MQRMKLKKIDKMGHRPTKLSVNQKTNEEICDKLDELTEGFNTLISGEKIETESGEAPEINIDDLTSQVLNNIDLSLLAQDVKNQLKDQINEVLTGVRDEITNEIMQEVANKLASKKSKLPKARK